MTALYVGVSVGGQLPKDVTTGTSTTSKDFEFVISNTTGTGVTRLEVLKALEAIEYYLSTASFP